MIDLWTLFKAIAVVSVSFTVLLFGYELVYEIGYQRLDWRRTVIGHSVQLFRENIRQWLEFFATLAVWVTVLWPILAYWISLLALIILLELYLLFSPRMTVFGNSVGSAWSGRGYEYLKEKLYD